MDIRHAEPADLASVLEVHRVAFGGEEEAELTAALLDDPSARPVLSLVAEEDGRVIGHVLLTAATVEGFGHRQASSMLLAPLGVVPEAQGRGVGGALVREALDTAGSSGVQLVFVLGYPDYYPRFGFTPAGPLGFEAPFPIPAKDADAWMVYETVSGVMRRAGGTVRPADALMRPELWRE